MEITDIRIKKLETTNRLKGIASMTIDNEFVIHDIKIIDGKDGLFVAMPSVKLADGFRDIAHPLNSKTREMVEKKILEKYYEDIE